MNRDEIMNMQAGPELDKLVIEKVMGWKLAQDENGVDIVQYSMNFNLWKPFFPSTDISDAFLVVEKMCAKGWTKFSLDSYEGKWSAAFSHLKGSYSQSYDDTPSHAISKAALLSLIQEDTPNDLAPKTR